MVTLVASFNLGARDGCPNNLHFEALTHVIIAPKGDLPLKIDAVVSSMVGQRREATVAGLGRNSEDGNALARKEGLERDATPITHD